MLKTIEKSLDTREKSAVSNGTPRLSDGDNDFVLVARSQLVQGLGSSFSSTRRNVTESKDSGESPGAALQNTDPPLTSDFKQQAEKKQEMKIPLTLLKSLGGLRLPMFRTKTHLGGTLQTPATGKYQWQFARQTGGTSTSLLPSDISNGGEWTSFNGLFSEFFVHSVTLKFQPYNQYLVGFVGTNSFLQTAGLTWAAYQHDQGQPTDGASNFYQLLNSSQSGIVHSGKPFEVAWKNITAFNKKGDANPTSVAGSTGWLNTADVANLGGRLVIASENQANVSPGATVFPVSTAVGSFYVDFDVTFRYRD